jgi:glycosyltransferase involved in cell wall biosynthesis
MRISVVIPAFNAAGFIAETIRSAQAQTLKPLEIIVVDDGSHDATVHVARDAGARVVRQAHAGVCAARNTGILTAAGEWIALLDHDDIWEPDKLERQAFAARLRPDAGFIACDFRRVTGDHIAVDSLLMSPEYHTTSFTRETVTEQIDHFPMIGTEVLRTGWFLFPSSVLVRRQLLLDAGLFREDQRLCEDIDCFLRVFRHTSMLLVREPLWRWRIHPGNTSRNWIGIAEGFLRLHEHVRRTPAAYPQGTAAAMAPIIQERRRLLVLEYLRHGLVRDARRVARSRWPFMLPMRDLAIRAVAFLPSPLLGVAWRAKRALAT